MVRKLVQVLAVAAGVGAPLTAFAGTPVGTVTVVPVGLAAPAINLFMLAVLAVGLCIAAAFILRRPSRLSTIATIATVMTLMGTAGYAAFITITIEGSECIQETTRTYPPLVGAMPTLVNGCDNAIKIIEITLLCTESETTEPGEVPPLCEEVIVLSPGDVCRLPVCDI